MLAREYAAGEALGFAIGDIEIEVPDGDADGAVSDTAVDSIIAATLYLALHTGSPVSAANQVAADGGDRKPITTSQWTVAAS